MKNVFPHAFFWNVERGEILTAIFTTLADLAELPKYKLRNKIDEVLVNLQDEVSSGTSASNSSSGVSPNRGSAIQQSTTGTNSPKKNKQQSFLPLFTQSSAIDIALRLYAFIYKPLAFHEDFCFQENQQGCNPTSFKFPRLSVVIERNLGTFHICRTLNKVSLQQYTPGFLQFQYQEQAQALKIQCKVVNSVYAVQQDKLRVFYISDLCIGGTLQYHMSFGAFNLLRARHTLVQLILAMEAYHDVGIVVQNLRPSNIYFTPDGLIKVGCLSLHSRLHWYDMQHKGEVTNSRESLADQLVFTAPEVIVGKDIQPTSDFWSLGVIFYAMLTGSIPTTRSQTCAISFRNRLKELHCQVNQENIDPSLITVGESAFYEVNNTMNGFKRFQMELVKSSTMSETDISSLPLMQVYTPLSCGQVGTKEASSWQSTYENCYNEHFVYNTSSYSNSNLQSQYYENLDEEQDVGCFSNHSTAPVQNQGNIMFAVDNPFLENYSQVTRKLVRDSTYLDKLREDVLERDGRTAQWEFIEDYLMNQQRKGEIAAYNRDLAEHPMGLGTTSRRISKISKASHMSDLPSYVSYDATPSISYTDSHRHAYQHPMQNGLDPEYGLFDMKPTDPAHSRVTQQSDIMSVNTMEEAITLGITPGTSVFWSPGNLFVDSSPFTLEDGGREEDGRLFLSRRHLDHVIGNISQLMEASYFDDHISLVDDNVIVEEEEAKLQPLHTNTSQSSKKSYDRRSRPLRTVLNRTATGKMLWTSPSLLRAVKSKLYPNFRFYACQLGQSSADAVFSAQTSNMPQPTAWGRDEQNNTQQYTSPRHMQFKVTESHQPSAFHFHDLSGLVRFYFDEKRWSPFDIHERVLQRSREPNCILDVDIDYTVKSHTLCPVTVDFFLRIFDPNPRTRLGAKGIKELKQHPQFGPINGLPAIQWRDFYRSTDVPPFVPSYPTISDFLATELLHQVEEDVLPTPYTFENKTAQNLQPAWYVNYPLRQKEAIRVLNNMDKKSSMKTQNTDSCAIS